MPDQRSARRRFQFRLRTLMLVVAIVAVQCAVCVPMLRQWQKEKEIEEIFREIDREIETRYTGGFPPRRVSGHKELATQP